MLAERSRVARAARRHRLSPRGRYSVPHRFEVDARITAPTVELFAKSERIAVNPRMSGNQKHTTVADYLPSSHRRYVGWTIDRIRQDPAAIGRDRRPVRTHPRAPAPSRAGLPRLARHHPGNAAFAAECRAVSAVPFAKIEQRPHVTTAAPGRRPNKRDFGARGGFQGDRKRPPQGGDQISIGHLEFGRQFAVHYDE
jgi:hypothetical protein